MLPKKRWALRPTLVGTTMRAPLPPEIFELVIDHLHDEPNTLKPCCLVSKSWVPRSRIHLFAQVTFDPAGSPIESWVKAFPDPSNSPVYHTRRLRILDPGVVSAGACSWIRSFRHVRELSVRTSGWEELDGISTVQLYGLSPTLKSLHLDNADTSIPEILGLICSFPLLEDLSLRSNLSSRQKSRVGRSSYLTKIHRIPSAAWQEPPHYTPIIGAS